MIAQNSAEHKYQYTRIVPMFKLGVFYKWLVV